MPRGSNPGFARAQVADRGDSRPLAEVIYGDSAEIRVTNLGRRNRANPNIRGFFLDLIKGRWLSETKGEQASDDDDGLEASQQDVRVKARVIPFVQDRRNVAVLRWTEQVSEDAAITLQYALERGMEIHFQLEDSELTSEILPDGAKRGRMLFVESAEGGAGVLRRLQAEPSALAAAARAALRLMHVDPDSGMSADDACVRGCYRCLLSYGNQMVHERIDRRLAITMLTRLLKGQTRSADERSVEPDPASDRPLMAGRAGEMEGWLAAAGLRRPAEVNVSRDGVHVDLFYSQLDPPVAVLVDDGQHASPDITPLVFGNVDVIEVSSTDDLWTVITSHPSVFGVADDRPAPMHADERTGQ